MALISRVGICREIDRDLLHASAPYMAVGIGLYCFRNAWLALLLYHLQIILYAGLFGTDIKKTLFHGFSAGYFLVTVLPLLFFGPLLHTFLPYILKHGVSLQEWLYTHGLSHRSCLLLMPYFGIIHPILEEIHWGRFRGCERRQWLMCFFFAGYHILVLASLLSTIWLIISFLVLAVVACLWTMLYKRLHGGIIPFLSHLVADVGIIGATYLFAFG
jgi:hypothetical protein